MPADNAFWYYWLDALARNEGKGAICWIDNSIEYRKFDAVTENHEYQTEKEGYEAMLYLIARYEKEMKCSDLSLFIERAAYSSAGTPNDPRIWRFWLESIKERAAKGPLYLSMKWSRRRT